jgi:hypothetical protein
MRNRIHQQIVASGVRKELPPDPAFLQRLAERLSVAACISPELARQRVEALAVSARPREPDSGFQARCR